MKSHAKTIRVALIEKRDWSKALQDFLLSYRATPHPATGATPASLMFPGRNFRTRLPACPDRPSPAQVDVHFERQQRSSKQYADNRRNAKECLLQIGDRVLVRQTKRNKFSTPFSPNPFIITNMNGTMVTAARNGYSITRNSTLFKKIPVDPKAPDQGPPPQIPPRGKRRVPSPPPRFRRLPLPPDRRRETAVTLDRETVGHQRQDNREDDGPMPQPTDHGPPSRETTDEAPGKPANDSHPFRATLSKAGVQNIDLPTTEFSIPDDFWNISKSGRYRKPVSHFQSGPKQ